MATVNPAGSASAGDGSFGTARASLLVLALASFSAVATELLPVGLLPAIGSAFGTSAGTTGLLVSAYAAVVMILSVPLALATRRFPGRRLLLMTMAGYALANLGCALAPSFEVMLLARGLGGLSHALFFSVCIGYAARLVPPARTGRALALVSAGITAGVIAGAPVAVAVGDAIGWRFAFAFLMLLVLVTAVLIALVLPAEPGRTGPDAAPTGRWRDAAAPIAGDALIYVGHFMLLTYVTVLLLDAGAARAAIAPLLSLFGLFGLLGTWGAASLLDRRPRRAALLIVGTSAAGMAAIGLVADSLLPVIAAAALWNVALGPVAALFQSATVRADAITPELAGAWINTASNVGITAGSLLGGAVLASADIGTVAWLGALPVVLAGATVLVGRRAFPRSTADEAIVVAGPPLASPMRRGGVGASPDRG